MKTPALIVLALALGLRAFAEAPDIDPELAALAAKLSIPIREHGKKKVTVVDFTDMHGISNDLGKYIAEQLTVDFVMAKREFAVLDRANLRSILAEHKLTSQGLVDPENAKKLGMFAGVDVLVLGVIIPKETNITLTAKLITTDTAEIIGAARAEFKADDRSQAYLSRTNAASANLANPLANPPKYTKSFGDLKVTVQSFKANGSAIDAELSLANESSKRSLWVALSTDLMGNHKSRITDPDGIPLHLNPKSISGIASSVLAQYSYTPGSFQPATEIQPKDSISVTLNFIPREEKDESPGIYGLQLEFIAGRDQNHAPMNSAIHNLITKLSAD